MGEQNRTELFIGFYELFNICPVHSGAAMRGFLEPFGPQEKKEKCLISIKVCF